MKLTTKKDKKEGGAQGRVIIIYPFVSWEQISEMMRNFKSSTEEAPFVAHQNNTYIIEIPQWFPGNQRQKFSLSVFNKFS